MSVKFCGECGSKIEPGMRFCSQCGWKVEDTIEEKDCEQEVNHESFVNIIKQTDEKLDSQPCCQPEYTQTSKSGPFVIIGSIVIGVLIIAISIMLFIKSNKAVKNERIDYNQAISNNLQSNNSPSVNSNLPTNQNKNIITDITFPDIQGEWTGNCILLSAKNMENEPNIPPDYAEKIQNMINVKNTCDLEVKNTDIKLDIDIGKGMYLELDTCIINQGVISYEKSESKEGVTATMITRAEVFDDNGITTINGLLTLKFGKAEMIYEYTVTQ